MEKKQPLAVKAYETIVKKIICLEYRPSQHLEEGKLMEDLGIGRTPVREALVRLHGERMVESHPNKGVIVRPITLQNTKAMFEGMGIIEMGIADIAVTKDCTVFLDKMRKTCQKLAKAVDANNVFDLVETNHTFHMLFAQCSQNEFLIRAAADVRTEAKRLSYLSYDNAIDPDRPLATHHNDVMADHDRMMAYLENRDADQLKTLILEHINTFRKRIIVYMTT